MRKSSITGGDRISPPIRLMWDIYVVGFSFYFVMQEYSRVRRCAPPVCVHISALFSAEIIRGANEEAGCIFSSVSGSSEQPDVHVL